MRRNGSQFATHLLEPERLKPEEEMITISRIISILFLLTLFMSSVQANDSAPPLPRTSTEWLDGKPYQWSDLKGKVVLLNVWTFGCWNSYRSFPWIVSLQKKYPELQIIGIHSPEFAYEKDRNQMRRTMESYGVHYPQILDDNHSYWKSLNNTYWPAFYIVDKKGTIRASYAGETHAGDSQSQTIEKTIRGLLME